MRLGTHRQLRAVSAGHCWSLLVILRPDGAPALQVVAPRQSITRAKGAIASANIPFALPNKDDRLARLTTVSAVIYLMFNDGFAANPKAESSKASLVHEAVRLGRILDS